MKKIKIMTCTFVIFLSQLVMNCQIKHINKIDSLQLAKDFNYFTHKYKHINKDFKINSNNETYQRIFKKNKFFENKNPDYIDSLQVVLTDEFTSSDYQRIALLRLGYTYKRLSLYVRTDEKKLKKIAKLYQINYPYQLKEKFDEKTTQLIELINIIDSLKINLKKENPNCKIDTLSNKALLNYSFKNNPLVHKLKKDVFDKKNIDKFIKKHGRNPNNEEMKKIGFECGKENCCQKK